MTTVADVLVEELQQRGVPFVATLNGHGLDPFYLACKRHGMRLVDVRNEQAAGYMAEVTGRLTRRVGVCAVSGAVAHVNALTGVLNAWFDGSPMLLITGTCDHVDFGWGNFQDFNPVPMSRPICKYARAVDVPWRVGHIVQEAFAAATTGRPGPVHLTLPLDVAAATLATTPPRSRLRRGEVEPGTMPDPDTIDQVASLLAAAQRPLLVAGSGVYYAHAEDALARLSQTLDIPVIIPIWDRGTIEGVSEQFMGVIGAATGEPRLVPDSDLLICVGVCFDYRIGQFQYPTVAADARVVRIDADERTLHGGMGADVAVSGSPRHALEQLLQVCRHRKIAAFETWRREAALRRSNYKRRCRAKGDVTDGLTGRDVMDAVWATLPDDAILLVDGGNIGQWFHQTLPGRYRGSWLTCGASGVVGWGLPGAMAARAVHPDRPIVLVSGDGAITFTVAELESAARQQMPFVAIVADDQQWGISVTGHIAQFGEPLNSLLGPTQLDRVAEGFGCQGLRAETFEEVTAAIGKGLQADRPTLIHVPIVPSSPDPTLAP